MPVSLDLVYLFVLLPKSLRVRSPNPAVGVPVGPPGLFHLVFPQRSNCCPVPPRPDPSGVISTTFAKLLVLFSSFFPLCRIRFFFFIFCIFHSRAFFLTKGNGWTRSEKKRLSTEQQLLSSSNRLHVCPTFPWRLESFKRLYILEKKNQDLFLRTRWTSREQITTPYAPF